jgi:hypothetical protein
MILSEAKHFLAVMLNDIMFLPCYVALYLATFLPYKYALPHQYKGGGVKQNKIFLLM